MEQQKWKGHKKFDRIVVSKVMYNFQISKPKKKFSY